jgi:acetyl esterase
MWRVPMDNRYKLERARRDWRLMIRAYASREPVADVGEHCIAGPGGPLRLRVYTPARGAAPRPVLLWYHGGGFILGDLYTAGATCRALANRSGAVVVAVRYRLAPEHPLRAGREDCLAALRWVAEHAGRLGGDRRRLAVGGDSAGGMLAAAIALQAARGGPELTGQLLVYPGTDLAGADLAGAYPSYEENADGYLINAERLAWIRRHIALVDDLADPELSPLRAADLAGVAPAVVVTAGFDPLRDEGLAYVDRLAEAGVAVRLLHYPAQIHGFVSFDRAFADAGDALDRSGAALAALYEGRGFGAEPGATHDGVVRARVRRARVHYHEMRTTQLWLASWVTERVCDPAIGAWRRGARWLGGS